MATTLQTIANSLTSRMQGPTVNRRNKVGATATTGEETIEFAYLDFNTQAPVEAGQAIEVGADGELMYVWAVTTGLATVERGYLGTTARSRTTTDIIEIEPFIRKRDVYEMVNEEIESWPRQIFKVTTEELEWPADDTHIDLGVSAGTDVHRILRCELHPFSSSVTEPYRNLRVRHLENVDEDAFPSGHALQLPDGLTFDRARTVSVTYASTYRIVGDLSYTDDLEVNPGLTPGLVEAVKYGVGWRLFSLREAGRTDFTMAAQQAHSEHVPPTHVGQTAAGMKSLRDQAIAREIIRLRNQWPIRTSA